MRARSRIKRTREEAAMTESTAIGEWERWGLRNG